MKGARAEPWEMMRMNPIRNTTKMRGIIHQSLRAHKNSKKLPRILNFCLAFSINREKKFIFELIIMQYFIFEIKRDPSELKG